MPCAASILHCPRSFHCRRYKGKIAFGEALRSNAEISREFGVSKYPTLLVICGGNKDVVVKYEGELVVAALSPACRLQGQAADHTAFRCFDCILTSIGCLVCPTTQTSTHTHTYTPCRFAGEMKSTKLSRFLNQFYSGKACAAAIKIGELTLAGVQLISVAAVASRLEPQLFVVIARTRNFPPPGNTDARAHHLPTAGPCRCRQRPVQDAGGAAEADSGVTGGKVQGVRGEG